MKKNLTILILSALAILIVVGIEIFLVTRIYRLETEKFDYRYREILQKGLAYIDKRGDNRGLASAYYFLNGQSLKVLPLYIPESSDTVKFKEVVLKGFHKTLVQKQNLDSLLTGYLKKMKVETTFQSNFSITNLVLFDNQKVVKVFNKVSDSAWTYPDTLNIRLNQIPVNHYSYYADHFEIGIDYYVDFNNKKSIVLKEVAGSLLIAFLALAAVSLIFLFSMRNLMEERRLSQLKTDFINNMTHELKTPLSTISIATRTLENDTILDDRAKIKETVSVIRRQNRQLTKQINHLLEISMWERKQFSLDRRMLDLEPFFFGLAEAFRWECNEKQCKLEERFTFITKTAYLDEVQMTVALHNLLINAVKYNSQDPEVILEVSCDDRLRISVTDNGIGIGKEDQKHIFDKFYRVSTGNVHKVKGLGLGLFYVKQIVEAHGGSIDVSSRPGKGSTFTLILPVHGKNQNSPG
ncbi:MAG: sensor histidine kinase [Porphyromonadaceae bacterium]|nr:MAG: sensor histidine kinase [Porphyromonadaceae bacterium]